MALACDLTLGRRSASRFSWTARCAGSKIQASVAQLRHVARWIAVALGLGAACDRPRAGPPRAEPVVAEVVADGVGIDHVLRGRESDPPVAGGEFVAGLGLWARRFAVPGWDFIDVFACRGRCTIPLVERQRGTSSPVPLVASTTTRLSGGRSLHIDEPAVLLGGAVAVATWSSRDGAFDVGVLVSCPPDDVDVDLSVRAQCHGRGPRALVESLARALDPLVFAR
jgi:hypothetical protein